MTETPSKSDATESFEIVRAGSALPAEATATTPVNVPTRGGAENPSAAALRERFGDAIVRVTVTCGETNVYVRRERVGEVIRWLHDDATQRYDYLADLTAVEYRDAGTPMEVVWHLRSLPFRRFLRVKSELDPAGALEIDSVWPIYKAADWMERECYDMFGIVFRGHPDLRRLLMWEQYREGYPLRKSFPLRGRFSRSEQLRQALAQNPEAKYSMEELSIADAFNELPADMRRRIQSGEPTGE